MAGVGQLLFGGGSQPAPYYIINSQPNPGAAPAAPTEDDATVREAERRERAAAAAAQGRQASILTDFALATQAPTVLKRTLGGA